MIPVLQSLLLADHVYQDRLTNKIVIAGTFSAINVAKLAPSDVASDSEPARSTAKAGGMSVGSPYAYISLTDFSGTVEFTLRYVFLQNDSVLLQTKFSVQSDDRLSIVEVVVPMPLLPVVGFGPYALELLCGDTPIGARRLIVREMTNAGATP